MTRVPLKCLVVAASALACACSTTRQPEPPAAGAQEAAAVVQRPGPCAAEIDGDGDGVGDSRRVYEYDGAGRVTRRATDADLDGAFEQTTLYRYAPDGALAEESVTWNGAPLVDRVHRYDELGLRVGTDLVEAGATSGRLAYRYDDQQRLVSTTRSAADSDEPAESHDFEYDEQGRQTADIYRGEAGEVLEVTTFEYDAAGNLVREDRHPRVGAPAYSTTTYDYSCWASN